MNKYQIGTNAGVVWRLLNDNKRWSYCELKKASGLSDKDLRYLHDSNEIIRYDGWSRH